MLKIQVRQAFSGTSAATYKLIARLSVKVDLIHRPPVELFVGQNLERNSVLVPISFHRLEAVVAVA